jgi:hypothetical protein
LSQSNASLQLLPEAEAERSKAEAVGSQLQGVVRTRCAQSRSGRSPPKVVRCLMSVQPSRCRLRNDLEWVLTVNAVSIKVAVEGEDTAQLDPLGGRD